MYFRGAKQDLSEIIRLSIRSESRLCVIVHTGFVG